jgi:hypothetical protein
MEKCKCDNHDQHLCQLTAQGMHKDSPDHYAHLVRDPQFVCTSCGRVAAQKENLCAPVRIGTWED